MKKFMVVIFVVFICVNFVSLYAVNNDIKVTVDGKEVGFPDAKPFIDANNRTLIPVRFVTEALGAKVQWNNALKQAIITLDDYSVDIRINDTRIVANKKILEMDTKAIIRQDRTFVPIRFVAQALGCQVEWVNESRTVVITTVKTKDINGFKVPVDTDLRVGSYQSTENININIMLKEPLEKQYRDIEFIISSKYSKEIAEKALNVVKKKTIPSYELGNHQISLPDGKIIHISSPPRDDSILIRVFKPTN